MISAVTFFLQQANVFVYTYSIGALVLNQIYTNRVVGFHYECDMHGCVCVCKKNLLLVYYNDSTVARL